MQHIPPLLSIKFHLRSSAVGANYLLDVTFEAHQIATESIASQNQAQNRVFLVRTVHAESIFRMVIDLNINT